MTDYFARLRGRVDRRHVASATIAAVGLGRVGAPIAVELARLIPRQLILVDGDNYEIHNCSAHPLPREYVGWNKAVAMAEYLHHEYPEIESLTAIPFPIGAGMHEAQIRSDVLSPASLVVIATDQLAVQRRVADIARRIDVPAIVPGLSEDGRRGEVFLSLSEELPCLECFDGYRPANDPVRGASLAGPDAFPTVHASFSLALAVLDGNSPEAELLRPLREDGPPPQLFRAWPPGVAELELPDDGRTEIRWRDDCPGCGGPPGPGQRPRRPAPRPTAAREPAVAINGQPLSWPSLDDIDEETFRWLAGIGLTVEFFVLLLLQRPVGPSAALMCLGIGVVVGLWLGLFGLDRRDR